VRKTLATGNKRKKRQLLANNILYHPADHFGFSQITVPMDLVSITL
jgi:hypothetical protein